MAICVALTPPATPELILRPLDRSIGSAPIHSVSRVAMTTTSTATSLWERHDVHGKPDVVDISGDRNATWHGNRALEQPRMNLMPRVNSISQRTGGQDGVPATDSGSSSTSAPLRLEFDFTKTAKNVVGELTDASSGRSGNTAGNSPSGQLSLLLSAFLNGR